MVKPQGYDQAPAYTGESQALPAGGYICKIIKAQETTSTSGRPMLAILFDIVEGEFKDYFRDQYDRVKQSNPDAKWGGVFRQLTDGTSTPFFKGMITSIEVSNSGYKWNWDEKTLSGKLFGGVFGREQYANGTGELRWATKCQSIRSVEAIRKGVEIPADKYLPSTSGTQSPAVPSYSNGAVGDFQAISSDDDLPF